MNDRLDGPDEERDAVTVRCLYVLTVAHQCHECAEATRVHALLLRGPFEVEGYPGVEPNEEGALLRYPVAVPADVVETMSKVSAGRWHLDVSRTYGDSYYMNHCEHCGAKIGDHHLGEPEAAFFPLTKEQATRISGHRVDGIFRFEDRQLSMSSWMDEWLRRAR